MIRNAAPDTQRDDCMLHEQALQTCRKLLIERPGRDYFASKGCQLLAEETLRQVCEALGDRQAAEQIAQNQQVAIAEVVAEREQARAEHLGELAAEREMVQAQTPVVNVQVEEAE